MIEIRSDRCDFREIWVDGKFVLEACKDTHDLETVDEVVKALGAALGVPVTEDSDYEWDDGLKKAC